MLDFLITKKFFFQLAFRAAQRRHVAVRGSGHRAIILFLLTAFALVSASQSVHAQAINQTTNGVTDGDAASINQSVGNLTVAPA